MKIQVRTYRAPALWASALVNGDLSTFDHPSVGKHELKRFQRWCKRNPVRAANTVDCSDVETDRGYLDCDAHITYTYHCKPRMPKWVDLGSDVNWQEHGGLWGHRDAPGEWTTIKFFPTEDCQREFGCKYLAEVTTHSLENPDLPLALEACGVELTDYPLSEAHQIEALHHYTSSWDETYYVVGNNARKVLADAKAGRGLLTGHQLRNYGRWGDCATPSTGERT